jgi:hypothetical protein
MSEGPVRDALVRENELVLRILRMGSGVTHVEFFRRSSGDLVFCEAAARPGGGGIDDIVLRAYGVNLVRSAIELQCGLSPQLPVGTGGPSSTVGVIGIYHSAAGDDRPATWLKERFPQVVSYAFAKQALPGLVRHCTDYAHKIVISTATRTDFDRTVRSVVHGIRSEGCARSDTSSGWER